MQTGSANIFACLNQTDLDGVVMAPCTELVVIAENAELLILVISVFIDITRLHQYNMIFRIL